MAHWHTSNKTKVIELVLKPQEYTQGMRGLKKREVLTRPGYQRFYSEKW